MKISLKKNIQNYLPSITDNSWMMNGTWRAYQTAIAAFGLLALELAVIRWTSGQIRIFAYFNNLVLISAFLGTGIGAALGRRFGGLLHLSLPMLMVLAIPLAFSGDIGLLHMQFPDSAVFMWTGISAFTKASFALHILVFLTIFALITLVFVCCGATLGALFVGQKQLRAYTWDLTGALVGILTFTIITYLNASPPFWFLLGGLPFLILSRTVISLLSLIVVVLVSFLSIDGAIYSPYNRIDVYDRGRNIEILVNHDFHQNIYNFSDKFLNSGFLKEDDLSIGRKLRDSYDLPFSINSNRNTALIVGAGTGNDVQAALRNNYRSVYAVDIDDRLLELGRTLHPEKPYAQRGVVPVVNDARAFFAQYRGEPFDVISFGLLDSHAMFSSMSTLRLDNYVYTVEGIRAAWRHVAPQGHLSVNFSVFAGPWIAERLYWTIAEATGKTPVAVDTWMDFGVTFLVAPDMVHLDMAKINQYPRYFPQQPAAATKITTDDWPFLYIRPGVFPWGYLLTLGAVIAMTILAVPLAFGVREFKERFDPVFFFLGAAFMLIETRGITSLSLVFGSTWLVNTSIFFGVLLVALIANLIVERFHGKTTENIYLWFGLLFVSLLFLWFFDNTWLNQFPFLVRGAFGGIINVLPVVFAGVIFSTLFLRTKFPDAALGSNLLGAVIGGCTEYLSMVIGIKSLILIATVFYILALYLLWRNSGPAETNREGASLQGLLPKSTSRGS